MTAQRRRFYRRRQFCGVVALSMLFVAGCTSKISAPNLGASVTASESVLARVSPTRGLVNCSAFAPDDGTRTGWHGITFECLADGVPVRGNQLRGRPTVAVVWASWCEPCRRELPIFAQFARSQSKVRVVGIGWRDDPAALQDYAKQTALPFASLVDRRAAIAPQWNVHAQPAVAFISAEGVVTHVERGLITSLSQLNELANTYAK